MATKISGADFKQFHSDDAFWPKGAWYDDGLFSINGVEDADPDVPTLKDDDVVQILSGYVMTENGEGISALANFYHKWARAKTHERVVIEVPKAEREKLVAFIASIGGKAVT